MPPRHFNPESNGIRLTSTPLCGATVSDAVLGKLKSSRLRNAGFMLPFRSFSPCLGSVHTSASSNQLLKFRWDMWELNPGLSPSLGAAPSGCSCPLSQVYCASPHDLSPVGEFTSEIEKSFSKAIYHVLDNTGQLLPNCFSPET